MIETVLLSVLSVVVGFACIALWVWLIYAYYKAGSPKGVILTVQWVYGGVLGYLALGGLYGHPYRCVIGMLGMLGFNIIEEARKEMVK